MWERIPHKEEGGFRLEDARNYIKEHEKQMDFMYGPFLKDLQRHPIHGRCLEIGAGPGMFTRLFAEKHPDLSITVTDVSPIMIALARKYIREHSLEDRVDFLLCNADDSEALARLGKFDFVYSLYSMHHWRNLTTCVRNLAAMLNDDGMLYLGDLKRVWWLYWLPINNRDIEEVRAAYRPVEVKNACADLDLDIFEIRTLFPYFLQSIVIRQQPNIN